MMRAELKSVVLWTLGSPSRDVAPGDDLDDPDHFGLGAQVFIGPSDRALTDSFDIMVASTSWLAERANEGWEGFAPSRLTDMPPAVLATAGVWLMQRWSWHEFETAIRQLCDDASPGPDWGTVASRIGRFLPWEWAYRYDEHVNANYGTPFPPSREAPSDPTLTLSAGF